jgi:hypothetical protein
MTHQQRDPGFIYNLAKLTLQQKAHLVDLCNLVGRAVHNTKGKNTPESLEAIYNLDQAVRKIAAVWKRQLTRWVKAPRHYYDGWNDGLDDALTRLAYLENAVNRYILHPDIDDWVAGH